jgi:hypothetical protein
MGVEPAHPSNQRDRIAVAIIVLPILFVLAWEGGWWLIPADLVWLVIEVRERGDRSPDPVDSTGCH